MNRREFERRLEEALAVAHTQEARHVLCYLDLDRFKVVNDSCGHMAGDGMLREVAALIKETVRDSDTVGRLGGDEFGLLLVGCPLEKARQIADDVVRKVNDYRFVWKDKIFNIGVSVGLIEISRESGAPDEVMSAADSACYVAKKQGNHVHVYSARDEAVARHRGEIQWLQRLQSALKDNRFELMAQPIVATASPTDAPGPALEVLLRLQDDSVPGGISPVEFLRAAERYRLMSDVDRWVVQTALTALGRGGIRLPANRSLAINLSGQTLGDPQFLEFVVDVLDRTGVAPSQLCFEVTENSVITNIEHAQRFIGVLHGMGCQFALDDFGTRPVVLRQSEESLARLSQDRRHVHPQSRRRLGQSGDGRGDDQARAHAQLPGHRRAGRRRRRARSRQENGRRFRAGISPGTARSRWRASSRGRASSELTPRGVLGSGRWPELVRVSISLRIDQVSSFKGANKNGAACAAPSSSFLARAQ